MLLIFSPTAHAQEVAVAQVDGHVTDPSGASIAGATVKMTEVERRVVHSTTTDATGRYELPNLPVGPYVLEVDAAGFKSYRQSGITLQVATNITVPVVMQIGAITETVEVTANASMVETKDNAIAQVTDQQRIVELPLNGRNLTQLLTLGGYGTSAPAGDLTGSKNIQGSNGSGTFSVAGGQANGVNYLLDGGDNNDAFSNVNLPIPFPDAVQEFNVQTSSVSAQYGLHPGGVVNIVTKSGSNAFHGDVFDFLRNYELNARPKGLVQVNGSVNQPARDSLKRNQFGGVVGGRIIKDKLFFFAGYQGTRQRSNPGQNTAHVPTTAALNGDFSVLDGGKSTGGCLSAAKALKDPLTGNPFPGNQIPVARFDPAAVKLVHNFIPTSSDPCGLFLFGQPANNPDDQGITRIDYVKSEKHNIYGRVYIYDYTAQTFFDGKNALTTGPNPGNRDRSETATFGDTYTFSPTKVNAFHATFDRRADNRGSASNLFSPNDLGVKMYDNIPNYIQLTISNYFNVACGTCAPGYFNVNNYQVSDDFTWIKGKHQLGFGFDGRKLQFNSLNNQQANGQISFGGQISGDALADLMLGRMASSSSQGFIDGNALSDYMRQTVFSFYAQDNFRATEHLTINLGIRWEPSLPAYDKQDRGNQFNLPAYLANYHTADPRYPNAPAGLLFAVDPNNPNGNTFADKHWAAFSPRVGLVWDPKGDGKQTIRTGFAMIHDTIELFYPERWTTNPPYASSTVVATGQFSDPWAAFPGGNPFPGAAIFPTAGTYVSIPAQVKPTTVLQWNIAYQRQIASNWKASVSYVGNRTNHILAGHEVNPGIFLGLGPCTLAGVNYSVCSTTGNNQQRRFLSLINPTLGAPYSSIIQTDDGNVAHYNALGLSIEHRFSHHVNWLANYTYSQCLSTYDFGGELAGNNYQNPNDRRGEMGRCNFDRRNIFNSTVVAVSPGIGNGMVNQITKEWELSPIVSMYSGQPFSITVGSDVSLTGVGADRPNVVLSSGVLPHTLASWFNQAAFVAATPGTFGDSGRDNLVNPGSINWDMAISRNFPFKERFVLHVRGDFFNIMNHANWNGPSGSMTSSTFGQITSFSGPRLIQLALKLNF